MKVAKIYLSLEDRKDFLLDAPEGQTDVMVILDSGEKYMASFISYQRLQDLIKANQKSKIFLSGTYYWVKNMILINECSKVNIRKVIIDLIDEGDFLIAFSKSKEVSLQKTPWTSLVHK